MTRTAAGERPPRWPRLGAAASDQILRADARHLFGVNGLCGAHFAVAARRLGPEVADRLIHPMVLGVFAGVYHWFPKMFGRFMHEGLGKVHFWFTFLAYYGTFFPMHYLGVAGMMRRIYDPNVYEYLKPLQPVNTFITICAFVLGTAQLLSVANYFWSMFKGRKCTESNPWQSNGLEWSTPPLPGHGNWEGAIPEVHRWPYDYNHPDEKDADFTPQWKAPVKVTAGG